MTLEQRLRKLESRIDEIYTVLIERDQMRYDGVNMPAYKRTIEAMLRGDTKPLEKYLARGGKIPVRQPETGKG